MWADVQAKRRVLARHERRVSENSEHPAVQAEHEVEDVGGVPVPKQEQNARDEDEDPDESAGADSTRGEDPRDAELLGCREATSR